MSGPVMDKQMQRRHEEAMKLVPFVDESERYLLLAEVVWPSERLRELESEAMLSDPVRHHLALTG